MSDSTNVIHLPSAAAHPVLQTRKNERLPKSIGNLRDVLADKRHAQEIDAVIANEIKKQNDLLPTLEEVKELILARLAVLSRSDMTQAEREKLAAEIRWDNLPWQQKEAVISARKGASHG